MKTKLALIPLVAVTALALSTGTSQARGQNNVVRLAHQIQNIGKDLKNEFQTHYKRSSQYQHLMADVNDLLKQANHIDSLAHDPRTSYRHIKTDLAKIDKLAHHLHALVDRIDRGCTTHVHAKLVALDRTIHSMQREIVVYAQPAPSCGGGGLSHYDQPARPTRPVSNARGGSSRQNGWSRNFGGWINSRFGW